MTAPCWRGSDEERNALHGAILESIEQMNRAELIDADEALARLRAHRWRSNLSRGNARRMELRRAAHLSIAAGSPAAWDTPTG